MAPPPGGTQAQRPVPMQLQLHLVPQPGSPPEFLAACVLAPWDTAEGAVPSLLPPGAQPTRRAWEAITAAPSSRASAPAEANDAPHKLVLEGYTRDAWATCPPPRSASASSVWVDLVLKSVDGRNKLPGFVAYLKERQKSAYGRFGPRGVLVVVPNDHSSTKNDPNHLRCRVALDLTAIPQCPLRPLAVGVGVGGGTGTGTSTGGLGGGGGGGARVPPQQQQPQPQPRRPAATASAAEATKGRAAAVGTRPSGGLLGKLVGAQHRTNQHMISTYQSSSSSKASAAAASAASSATGQAPAPAAPTSSATDPDETTNDDGGGGGGNDHGASPVSQSPSKGGGGGGGGGARLRTAQEVFAEFRQLMQDKMLDFDMAESDDVLQVTVTLSEHTAGLSGDDRTKVTMEVLKYMVYEAAEEVNEEWVVHKEPSEFVDEATFAIYKEGAAPPDVLEEINRAELPDEIKAQQRAVASERQRQADQAHQQHLQKVVVLHAAHDEDGDDDQLEALNQRKRDRRTIEDYERERRETAAKKGRT